MALLPITPRVRQYSVRSRGVPQSCILPCPCLATPRGSNDQTEKLTVLRDKLISGAVHSWWTGDAQTRIRGAIDAVNRAIEQEMRAESAAQPSPHGAPSRRCGAAATSRRVRSRANRARRRCFLGLGMLIVSQTTCKLRRHSNEMASSNAAIAANDACSTALEASIDVSVHDAENRLDARSCSHRRGYRLPHRLGP